MANKGWKHKKTPIIIGNEKNPTKMESGQVIINKKATKQNLDKLIKINNDGLNAEKSKVSTDGTDGGILKGKPHYDSKGNSLGGIPVIVDGGKKIEVEGDEFVVNKEASQKHWKELSKINQSAGNGVPINPSDVGSDDDPQEFRKGGTAKIIFNPNHIPNKWIYSYAKKIKEKYPKVWDMGGNIFGNEAFKNLERVIKRGYWTDNEEWMYIKWQSYVARHHKDFRIAGTVAMLKWVDKTDKGWDYMKALIDKEVAKKYLKKGFKRKLSGGGGVNEGLQMINKTDEFGEKYDIIVNGIKQGSISKADKEYFAMSNSTRGGKSFSSKRFDNLDKAKKYIYSKTKTIFPLNSKSIMSKMGYGEGGGLKDITCKSCNWSWNKSDSEKHDEYVCHKCGADNKMENAEEFMRWYIDWNKTINKKINISFSLPNIIQPFKESNVVILDLFEKIDQKIDAKQYLNKIIENADKYRVVIYLEPIPRYKYFLKNIEKRKKISKDYLISYYQKFGFELTTNGRFMKRLPKPITDNKKKYGGELAKGIKVEAEHQNTFKKVYAHELNPKQAPIEIAKEHLKEDKNYYSKLAKTEKFDTGGTANTMEIGDIVRGEYFTGIYGNFRVVNLGANGIKVQSLLTGHKETRQDFELMLLIKKGTNQVATSSPAKSTNTGNKIPLSYVTSGGALNPSSKQIIKFEVGDIVRTRWDNWPVMQDYESPNNIATVTKKTLNADGEYEYDINSYDINSTTGNTKYTGRYLGKNLELAVERPVANNFKFEIGDKVIYKGNNEKATIEDKEFFGNVYFYNIVFDTGIRQNDVREIDLELESVSMPMPNVATVDTDILPSFIASTVSTSWLNEYNVGDKVRIRVDFTGDKKKYNTVIKDQENTYDKPENVFTIQSFIKGGVRPENPSGKLYTLSNLQAWEGKDLELVRATNNKDAINAQASKPKFVSMDFQPFLQNWITSNLINSIDLTKKEIVKDAITDFILNVEAVDGNQTIKFEQEAKILDNIDNYIN